MNETIGRRPRARVAEPRTIKMQIWISEAERERHLANARLAGCNSLSDYARKAMEFYGRSLRG